MHVFNNYFQFPEVGFKTISLDPNIWKHWGGASVNYCDSFQRCRISEIKIVNLSIVVFCFLTFFVFIISPQSAFAVPTISWDTSPHFLDDGAVGAIPNTITVNDMNANTSAIDSINVKVTSTSDPNGIIITLKETGNNTAIFQNRGIIFMKDNNLFPLGSTITVTSHDSFSNADPSVIDSVPFQVQSTSDPAGFIINFNETGVDTGIFTGKIELKTLPSGSSGNILNVTSGDEFTIQNTNWGLQSNGLVTPNPDPTYGAIIANIGDTVTATYEGISANTTIGNNEPGGGGGGIIHPGFVLDLIAQIVGGSPFIVSPPSFGGTYNHYSDGLTITQGTHKTTFDLSQYNQEIPTQVMRAEQKINMTFKTFESYNPTAVIHMGLYIIPRGQDMITPNSIASIVYEKNSPVEVNDPNHILSNASASSTTDGKFQYTKFSFVPTKSYDKMSFLARAWNDHMYSTDVRVHDEIIQPPSSKILPAGVIKYYSFNDLQEVLGKAGFHKPQIMAHIHSTTDVFTSTKGGNVYWLYDTNNQAVTLMISDKDGNTLYCFTQPLIPNEIQPKGDYGFMKFTIKQLNRENIDEEQKAMKQEEIKAMEKN
jgi:hypothetical protein